MPSSHPHSHSENGFHAARIIASLAIVWVHTPRSTALTPTLSVGVFGTAFFAAAAMFFMVRSLHREPARSFPAYCRKRLVRLGVPFLLWTIFYLLFRDFCRVVLSHERALAISPSMLLLGSELQLWFLPFLLLASLLMFPIVKLASRSHMSRKWGGGLLAFAGLLIVLMPVPAVYGSDDLRHFQKCVWYVLPCVFWGLSAALNYDWMSRTILRSRWTLAFGIAITLASMTAVWLHGNSVCGKNIGGLGWLIVSLSMPSCQMGNKLARLAPLGFGIYLTHPFFQGIFRAISQKIHWNTTAASDLALFAFSVAGAVAFSWLLRQNQRTAWLIA